MARTKTKKAVKKSDRLRKLTDEAFVWLDTIADQLNSMGTTKKVVKLAGKKLRKVSRRLAKELAHGSVS